MTTTTERTPALGGYEAEGEVKHQWPAPKPEGEAVWLTRGMNARDEWMPWTVISETAAAHWKTDVTYRNGRRQVLLFAAHPAPEPVEGIREKVARWLHAEFGPVTQHWPRMNEPQRNAWRKHADRLSALQSRTGGLSNGGE